MPSSLLPKEASNNSQTLKDRFTSLDKSHLACVRYDSQLFVEAMKPQMVQRCSGFLAEGACVLARAVMYHHATMLELVKLVSASYCASWNDEQTDIGRVSSVL